MDQKEEPTLPFLCDFVYKILLGLLNLALELEKKKKNSTLMFYMIMFKIAIIHFLKAHDHICICIST